MRQHAWALCALLSAVQPAAAAPDPGRLSSTIRDVTVFSDRARVVRAADVSVSEASQTLVFSGLPGWVDDATVRVALVPNAAGRIADVRVQRDFLARSTDESYQKAEQDVARLQAELVALDDELAVLQARAKQVESIKAFSLEKVSRDTVLHDVSVEKYGKVLDFITVQLRDIAKARRDVATRRQELLPQLVARKKALDEMKSLTQLEQTSVYVTLAGPGAPGARLELTYMLPGATWEPAHELRTGGADPNSASLTSFAVVSQTSGEDWTNAKVTFATQSSTQATRIPQLESLTLGSPQAARRMIERRSSSFNRAKQAFGQQNLLWNRYHQKVETTHFEEVYQSNVVQLQSTQSKTVAIFRSLQQRGTSAHFEAAQRVTVRGDGHPVRVKLGASTLATREALVAAPEQSLNAARTIRMRNTSPRPILPGKVGLYHDGAFLGMTEVAFVAESEEFSMFLGVADHIKLTRTLDKKHSSLVRKARTRMTVAFIVTAENLSAEPTTLNLADRIPVSENREIRVDRVSIEPDVKADSRGLVNWNVALEPGAKKTFRISYRVEYPPTLILETQRRARAKRRMNADAPDFAPATDAVEEQIMELEKRF